MVDTKSTTDYHLIEILAFYQKFIFIDFRLFCQFYLSARLGQLLKISILRGFGPLSKGPKALSLPTSYTSF